MNAGHFLNSGRAKIQMRNFFPETGFFQVLHYDQEALGGFGMLAKYEAPWRSMLQEDFVIDYPGHWKVTYFR